MQDTDFVEFDFSVALAAEEETLEVEFKRELDLSTPEGKAKLAQEIGAISNFGGGWIVLGRNDDGSFPERLPDVLTGLSQDIINQVASAYLLPAPHCIFRWIEAGAAPFAVPVIRVPNVGAVPICGKKNGPQDDRNRTVGIRKGVHYYRAAGPVSAPIESPEQWRDVIRRCVLNDRKELLGALNTMLERPVTSAPADVSALDQQFTGMVSHWEQLAFDPDREVNPAENYVAVGFELVGASEVLSISIDDIRRALQARTYGHYGPHRFFDEQTPVGHRPYVLEIADVAGLQVDAVKDETETIADLPYVWRLAENFTGVEVVSFWEDTEWVKGAVERRSTKQWQRGGNFWPAMHMEYIDGFLSNVWHFAEAFGFKGSVRTRLAYSGLAGRQINSANPGAYYSMRYVSRQSRINVDLTFDSEAFEESVRSAAIAALLQPVNKFFQGPEITAEGVVRSLAANRGR